MLYYVRGSDNGVIAAPRDAVLRCEGLERRRTPTSPSVLKESQVVLRDASRRRRRGKPAQAFPDFDAALRDIARTEEPEVLPLQGGARAIGQGTKSPAHTPPPQSVGIVCSPRWASIEQRSLLPGPDVLRTEGIPVLNAVQSPSSDLTVGLAVRERSSDKLELHRDPPL